MVAGEHAEHPVIPPTPVNVEVLVTQPFLRHSDLFDDAQTLDIFRAHADLDAMHSQRAEAVVTGHGDGGGDGTSTCMVCTDPVPDRARQCCTVGDVEDRHLTSDREVVRIPGRMIGPPIVPDQCPGQDLTSAGTPLIASHHLCEGRRLLWAARWTRRLPSGQPVLIALS